MPISAVLYCKLCRLSSRDFSKNFPQSDVKKDSGDGISLSHACISHEAVSECVLNN
jgi:hypothetical protein